MNSYALGKTVFLDRNKVVQGKITQTSNYRTKRHKISYTVNTTHGNTASKQHNYIHCKRQKLLNTGTLILINSYWKLQDYYFIWQWRTATSCWPIYCINAAH